MVTQMKSKLYINANVYAITNDDQASESFI